MADLLFNEDRIGPIEGVLFDKDGTLSHSEPHLRNLAEGRITAGLALWVAAGRPESDCPDLRQNLKRAFGLNSSGLDPAGTLAVASRRDNLTSMATVFCLMGCSWPEAHRLAIDSFERVDPTLSMSPKSINPLLPGATALIRQLVGAGIKVGVISNDTEQGIRRFLVDHNLSQSVQGIWSADNVPAKPDPRAVVQLCEQLNLKPGVCALMGDAETDLQMGRDAGVGLVIGYTGGWSSKPQLSTASLLINDWNDLSIQADT